MRVLYYFSIAGINVKLKGEANTCWATDRQDINHEGHYENESQTLTGHEEYFTGQYYILGSPSGKYIKKKKARYSAVNRQENEK